MQSHFKHRKVAFLMHAQIIISNPGRFHFQCMHKINITACCTLQRYKIILNPEIIQYNCTDLSSDGGFKVHLADDIIEIIWIYSSLFLKHFIHLPITMHINKIHIFIYLFCCYQASSQASQASIDFCAYNIWKGKQTFF